MIAFSNGESWGWKSLAFWGCVAAGLALVVLFIVRQFHTSHPLLNFAVLKYKPFVLTLLVQCTLAMTLGINAILSQFYFQTGRGFSPAATGLFLMVPSTLMLSGNVIANALHKRGWMRGLITGGMAFALVGNLGLCRLSMDSNLLFVMCCYTLRFLAWPFADAADQLWVGGGACGAGWPCFLDVQLEQTGGAGGIHQHFNGAAQFEFGPVLSGGRKQRRTGKGTMAYRLAAIEAVNTDYLYLAVALAISLCCTFLIKPQKEA